MKLNFTLITIEVDEEKIGDASLTPALSVMATPKCKSLFLPACCDQQSTQYVLFGLRVIDLWCYSEGSEEKKAKFRRCILGINAARIMSPLHCVFVELPSAVPRRDKINSHHNA
ncbi:hypothetical protein ACTXT7_009049 [Hymenolepis weldensis]